MLSLKAEAWFWRVFAATDDFGNAEADPEACKIATAGKRKVTVNAVAGYLEEMYDATLISFYWVKGERFLHINRYEEMQPAGRNGRRVKRFPGPELGVEESRGNQGSPADSVSAHNQNTNDHNNDHHNDHQISLASRVRTVFDFWKEHLNHPRAILDKKREGAIGTRLKDGYSVDDLRAAIKGCKLTPYNMGDNRDRRVYDDIELICRDSKHVEQFVARITNVNAPAETNYGQSKVDRSMANVNSVIAELETKQ